MLVLVNPPVIIDKVEDTQTKSGKNLIVFQGFGYDIDKLLNSKQTCTA